MQLQSTLTRWMLALVGFGAIAGTGYMAAEAGLQTPLAASIVVAVVGASSIGVGFAWRHGHWIFAIFVAVALLAGEVLNVVSSAERVMKARVEGQQPAHEKAERHRAAATRLKAAQEAAWAPVADTSPRLKAAEKAKAEADATVLRQAAEKGCRENCRLLLQQQVDTAQVEVTAARAEVEGEASAIRERVSRELADARASLAASPLPASASPLADWLGVTPIKLDAVIAGLTSLTTTGLGTLLLALGVHGGIGPRQGSPAHSLPSTQVYGDVVDAEVVTIETPADAVARFRVTLRPSLGARVRAADVQAAYSAWCIREGVEPVSPAMLGRLLALSKEKRGGWVWYMDVALPEPLLLTSS